MKKKVTIWALLMTITMGVTSFSSNELLGQNLNMVWENILGGSSDDYAYAVVETSDGNIVYAGFTNSTDYCIYQSYGATDGWIVKLNNNGDTLWSKSVGGSSDDFLYGITSTDDGGIIAVGFTSSEDYYIHENKGMTDCWAVCLNINGDTLWSKTYGGSSMDFATSITKTNDGFFVIGGFVASSDGDVSGNHGGMDMWTFMINNEGNFIWGKTIGGSGDEQLFTIKKSIDNKFLIVGSTNSSDGDFVTNEGGIDIALAKLDVTGNIIFSKSYGASSDETGYSLYQNEIGDIQICGATNSINGIFTDNHGAYDAFVLNIDSIGQLLWSQCYGGSSFDMAYNILPSENKSSLVISESWSLDGQVSENFGYCDIWTFQIDSTGNLMWDESFGGVSTDMPCDAIVTTDDKFIIAGNTSSWDTYGGYGDENCWLFELESETTGTEMISDNNLTIYPNPVSDQLTINLNTRQIEQASLEIVNINGHIIHKESFSEITNINMSRFPNGIYFIKINASNNYEIHKIIINK